ncbi:sporulation transcriptional regulator SpoIIID [Sporosarcina sp. NCCP-2716]|uniref:sporulation transcriptional regulator SpoIIID n=1 Tax=Sporosarcina sp. NCCP-2716 TaxID=2943679 RepID=UPI00203C5C22|nr:sporulation transcriptional regulator SpoIIID [Sporosarcina sp. NCCP-2716]GKV69168.1 sporulation transcriptional regulator SpoIIID [Sporosarcina sp. NCCP-2716]
MHEQIRRRSVRLGNLLIETGLTVRALAKATGYSKSTIHKDLTERLPNIDAALSEDVAKILAYHKSIRHLRGGEATRQKWKLEQQKLNELAEKTD